jgi:hypothetical protein
LLKTSGRLLKQTLRCEARKEFVSLKPKLQLTLDLDPNLNLNLLRSYGPDLGEKVYAEKRKEFQKLFLR